MGGLKFDQVHYGEEPDEVRVTMERGDSTLLDLTTDTAIVGVQTGRAVGSAEFMAGLCGRAPDVLSLLAGIIAVAEKQYPELNIETVVGYYMLRHRMGMEVSPAQLLAHGGVPHMQQPMTPGLVAASVGARKPSVN